LLRDVGPMSTSWNGAAASGGRWGTNWSQSWKAGSDSASKWASGGGGASSSRVTAYQRNGTTSWASRGQPWATLPAVPAPVAPAPLKTDKVHVRGLPPNTDSELLREVFCTYGKVEAEVVDLEAVADDGDLETVAILQMESVELAESFVEKLHGKVPDGLFKPLHVQLYDPRGQKRKTGNTDDEESPAKFIQRVKSEAAAAGVACPESACSERVIIKNLPPSIADDVLQDVFSAYGTVASTQVLPSEEGSETSVAVVTMSTVEEAKEMVANLSGKVPSGLLQPVQINFADDPSVADFQVEAETPKGSDPAIPEDPLQERHSRTVFITRLPEQIEDVEFQELFQDLGEIETMKLFRESRSGFVRFAKVDQARMAKEVMHGFEISGTTLCVKSCGSEVAAAARGAAASGANGHVAQRPGVAPAAVYMGSSRLRQENTPSDRLYIKRLPPKSTAESVTELFAAYGTVVDVRILYANEEDDGDSGVLLKMASVEEAMLLKEQLNNTCDLPGLTKSLYINFANPLGASRGKGVERGTPVHFAARLQHQRGAVNAPAGAWQINKPPPAMTPGGGSKQPHTADPASLSWPKATTPAPPAAWPKAAARPVAPVAPTKQDQSGASVWQSGGGGGAEFGEDCVEADLGLAPDTTSGPMGFLETAPDTSGLY